MLLCGRFLFEINYSYCDLENLNKNQKALLEDMRYKIENNIPYLDIDFTGFSDLLK
jgi:hypothetical protein